LAPSGLFAKVTNLARSASLDESLFAYSLSLNPSTRLTPSGRFSNTVAPDKSLFAHSSSVSPSTRLTPSGPFAKTSNFPRSALPDELDDQVAGEGANFLLIGLIAAGVLLIVLAVVLFLLCRRAHSSNTYELEEENATEGPTALALEGEGVYLTQEAQSSSELDVPSSDGDSEGRTRE
jgi:hypothetical protein